MLFRAGRTKRLVLLSAWVTRWSLASSVPVSRCGARLWGCRSFLRRGVRHEAVRRETVGRDQSEGATSPGSGVICEGVGGSRSSMSVFVALRCMTSCSVHPGGIVYCLRSHATHAQTAVGQIGARVAVFAPFMRSESMPIVA